jgi:hypothetical protein
LNIYLSIIASEVRYCRFYCQQDGRDNEEPHMPLREGCQIGTSDHADQDATPFQQTDIKHRPNLCPE